MSKEMIATLTPEEIAKKIVARKFDVLSDASLEAKRGKSVARTIYYHYEVYEPLLLGTATFPKRWYDWNVGFMVPHLDLDHVIEALQSNRSALAASEGIAWGLGEAGSDDERIVDFLYYVCERCLNYDAWWCAAEALEKLKMHDATDLKKRTLRGEEEWNNLDYCLNNLDQRAALIGILNHAKVENTESLIIPRCREALGSDDRKTVQNAVWLIERLRIDDEETIRSLFELYEVAEDKSHTLKPRIVEAFGQIASPQTRTLLEAALRDANYYRTRAYAAVGLGKIGDFRSVSVLKEALSSEHDERVLGHITQAIYSIENTSKRIINQRNKNARWPENGMIVDQSNKWYANPDIYDKFSFSEDPIGVSFEYALSRIPVGATTVADLGTGTGRFAIFSAERRPDILKVFALDANPSMHAFLKSRLKQNPGWGNKINALHGDINKLPFEDASIDAVISSWGFPSNMWNPEICLRQVREVHRVLKPGGRLVTVGWDETFRDELSELWYRFVPEPNFRRETIEEWRKRRRERITSPRNCQLTFVKTNLIVPMLFNAPEEAALVLGYLFGFSAGEWVSHQQRCEFSINVGITDDDTNQLEVAAKKLEAEVRASNGNGKTC